MEVEIGPLSRHPELVPAVARWHWNEWGHTDPGGSLESWTAALGRQADASAIPGTLLALAGETPVGVVCLVAADMPGYPAATGLGPWVKGLSVIEAARRRGIGQLLTRRAEAWAGALGHRSLYLYTERGSAAQALYLRLGWRTFDTGHYEDIDVTLMRAEVGAGRA